jgi:two-component system, sensor histidine kinase and response regulator
MTRIMKMPFRVSYARLLIIMIIVALMTATVCDVIIYNFLYKEKKTYLKELCINQLMIIKSIYRETNDETQILNILREQNRYHSTLGKTGEYIIATLKNDSISLLLDLRRIGYSNVHPIPWDTNIAEPIKYALLKKTGFLIGHDYSGKKVLAYCTYIPELRWGLVAKMDTREVNDPFYNAGIFAILASLILVLLGTKIFRQTFEPILGEIISSEKRYKSLFDYSAIPIWEADFSVVKEQFDKLKESGITDFRAYFEKNSNEIRRLTSLVKITYVNKKSVAFLGANNEDEIIRNLLAYFNEASLEAFKDEITGLAEGIIYFETELPIRTLNGEIKTLLFHMAVMPGHENDLSIVLISFVDITERKKAEEALLLSQQNIISFLDATMESLYMFDKNGIIMAANVTAAKRLRLEVSDIVGHNFNEFVPEDIAVLRQSYIDEVVNSGNPVQFEDSRDNYFFEHNFFPVFRDHEIIGVVSFSRDITEHKKVDEDLMKSEAQLRDLIATKDRFFNIVAHDLKNPFTSLLGSTELLSENIHLMDSEKIRRLALILNESAKSGYAILLNLLDWSRSQTGLIRLCHERINLKDLIDNNISDLRLYSTNKNICISSEVKDDIFICSDKNVINTVLRNLLSNGLKFTQQGGKVTVSVTSTETETSVSVKDTGIGISQENIYKLFRIDTKFQLSGTENEQGTGLGLKLCNEFVEKLGGRIWVESTENEGSDFRFTIPVVPPDGADETDRSKLTILNES